MSTAENILQYLRAVDSGKASQSEVTAVSARVTAAEGDITTLQGTVSGHTTSIGTNTGDIATNAGDITTLQGTVSGHTTSIGTNTGDIATNAGDITTLQGQVTALEGVNDIYYFVAIDSALTYAGMSVTAVQWAGGSNVVSSSGGFSTYNTSVNGSYVARTAAALQVPSAGVYEVTYQCGHLQSGSAALFVMIGWGDVANNLAFNADTLGDSIQYILGPTSTDHYVSHNVKVDITDPATQQIFVYIYSPSATTFSYANSPPRNPYLFVRKLHST